MRLLPAFVLFFQLAAYEVPHVCVRDIVAPSYPRLARMAQLQGSVWLELKIDQSDRILSAQGSGAHRLLVEEAEKNIRQWTFAPIAGAVRFPITHRIEFRYQLKGKPRYDEPIPKVIFHLPDRVEITSPPFEMQTEAASHAGGRGLGRGL